MGQNSTTLVSCLITVVAKFNDDWSSFEVILPDSRWPHSLLVRITGDATTLGDCFWVGAVTSVAVPVVVKFLTVVMAEAGMETSQF